MTTSEVRRRSHLATWVQRARHLWASLAVLALGACDFPTELPIFEPRLVIEAERTTLSVQQLLPASVTVAGNNFGLSLAGSTTSRTLADLCASCPPLNNTTAPKPEFSATITANTNLPADVRSATLVSGNLVVAINNQFSFDPIRPPGGSPGTAVITVTNGGRTIGARTLNGATDAIPANSTSTFTIPMTAGALSGTGPITASVVLTSPAGGTAPSNWVFIRNTDQFTITATPQAFVISNATVGVTNKTVNVTQVTLDLDDIDETLEERVKEGALVLTIQNPFGVTGTLTATFSGQGVSVQPKTITLGAGTTTQRIAFTGAELKSMLGAPGGVRMAIAGPVNGPATGVTVTPTQVLSISTNLDITLTTKSD